MVFSSPLFIFVFLPLVLFIYYLIDEKFKNIVLLIASLIFYAWSGVVYLLLVIVSVIVNYFVGVLIGKYRDKGKAICVAGIVFNLSILGFFKYFNFFVDNIEYMVRTLKPEFVINEPIIPLPIGISFFTFQIMSYVIDTYKGKVAVQKNIINLGLYIMFFPQLIAGPIVKYIDIEEQIKVRACTLEKFEDGARRFIIGFFKKIILANHTGQIASWVFDNHQNINSVSAWIGIICYTFQIFYDFSAYSDMAIGLGKMFGFEFNENFNFPYIAKSIQDFWRRWHISLSTWFREYLYIPLGGNRKGVSRTYINLLIVFFATGLWHGASWNFIIWGLFHGLFLVLERGWFGRMLAKVPDSLKHIYTLLVVLVGWVFFRTETLSDALYFIKNMFVPYLGNWKKIVFQISNQAILSIVIAILLCLPIEKRILNRKHSLLLESGINVVLLLMFVYSILMMSTAEFNPFIYFRF